MSKNRLKFESCVGFALASVLAWTITLFFPKLKIHLKLDYCTMGAGFVLSFSFFISLFLFLKEICGIFNLFKLVFVLFCVLCASIFFFFWISVHAAFLRKTKNIVEKTLMYCIAGYMYSVASSCFIFSFPFWWVLLFFSLLFRRHLLSFLVLMNCIAGYNWCNENTASGTCFMSIFVFRTSLAYLVLLEPLLYTHGCFLFVSHMFF